MNSAAAVQARKRLALDGAWQFALVKGGAASDPLALAALAPPWQAAIVPGTVAAAWNADGQLDWEVPPARLDAHDVWYRCRFPRPAVTPGTRVRLRFEGLATVAEVWLNGTPLGRSESMFLGRCHDVASVLGDANELLIRFCSLDACLAAKRPRPRWRAPMVQHQQLRFWRTTLLGRTPGWSPPLPAVGPWRPVFLEEVALDVTSLRLRPRLEDGDGVLAVMVGFAASDESSLANLRVDVTGHGGHWWQTLARVPADAASGEGGGFEGTVRIPGVSPWWPHTHGEPSLYDVRITALGPAGEIVVHEGRVGFRSVALDTSAGGFALAINGQPIFCRGACWTPIDTLALHGSRPAYARVLAQVRAAGMNMLRVGGTMVYEADAFADLCDELGILVWQDFMFANMDYPATDPGFAALVEGEIREELSRWQGRPSLALLCGNSEGEQQAAMWGAPVADWRPKLFHETLPALCQRERPDVPYWPSSASGGPFPHAANAGSSSYYGVGAYLRPLDDARRAEVRFASECLGFANIPEPRTLAAFGEDGPPRVHSAAWKARTPRDLGAGWDFEDVRDHYVRELFGVDVAAVRYADHDRYLALGRAATGEVMAATFAEWRRARSTCRGALVWFLRDLWPGAGWGVLGADAWPKAAFFYLRRVLQPVALFISDEGVNGLVLHVVNERAVPLVATLHLALFRDGDVKVGAGARSFELAPRSHMELGATELLEGFADLSYAYRFGPATQTLIHAVLRETADESADPVAEAFHFPVGRGMATEADVGLLAVATPAGDGRFVLAIETRRFAQSVAIDAGAFLPDDNHFHLAPGGRRRVVLTPTDGTALRGTLRPLNATATAKITIGP